MSRNDWHHELAKAMAVLAAVGLIGAGWLLAIAIDIHRDRMSRLTSSATIRLAEDARTVEAWSRSGVLVWESEPGDPGHDVLLSIIAEATAADTLTTRTLPEEGPST